MRGILALAATSGFLLGSSLPIAAFAQGAGGGANQDLIKRGEYLVTAGDCAACHTGPSGKRLAGNYVLNTPIGKIRTPNLTPDDATGLGKWTEADFIKAMHEGIDNEGHYLYPAFPFAWFTKVSTDDVKAIWAYLRSLEPVNEPRKENEIPFPFNIRTALITWRTAFFTPGEWKPDPKATAEVNRGGYLVEGLGHCGMCHNENKIVGNSSLAGKLGGGVIDGWYAPNITPDDHQGIGSWTEDQVVTYLKTGTAPGNKPGVAAGPMRQTIDESLSKMTDADLKAMVAYLRTYQAKQTYKSKDLQAYDTTGAPGAGVYLSYCSSCHQPDGKGVEGAIPALAGNTSVQSAGPETVLRVIYGGLAAQSGYAPMTAIGQGMTDQQVADVTDYIRNSWGNSAPVLKSGVAAEARKATSTMLAGNAPCAEVQQPDVAKALADADAVEQLKGLKAEDFIPRLDVMLPKIKAALPAGRDDDIVNGLTTAFCKAAKPATEDVKLPWHATIGSFSNLVYSQLKHPERKQAGVTMPNPAMPNPAMTKPN